MPAHMCDHGAFIFFEIAPYEGQVPAVYGMVENCLASSDIAFCVLAITISPLVFLSIR